MSKTICLALTGASGMPYGLRLLECLLEGGCKVQLLYSQASQVVARQEMDFELPSRPSDAKAALLARFPAVYPENLAVFGREEWFAPVASGSNPPDAMVVCPCSMGTLAAIAQGLADNLSPDELAGLKPQIAQLSGIMRGIGKAREGDTIAIDFLPDTLKVALNGAPRGEVAGAALPPALLKVWLGHKPVDASLKKALLGQ